MALFRRSQAAPITRAQADFEIPTYDRVFTHEHAVESLSAVFRCTQVIGNLTSNLNIDRLSAGTKTGPFSGFAENMDDREFIISTAVSLAGWGNAYWRKPTLKFRSWKYSDVLHPNRVSIRPDGLYQVTHKTGQTELLTSEQITHLKFLVIPGREYGIGPLGALRSTVSFAHDLNDYAASVFTDGEYPSGTLNTDQQLPPAVAEAVAAKWSEKHKSPGRVPAILTNGLKYSPLVINPTDAAFVESFNLSVQDIGRAFGIPGSFMGVSSGDSLTYSTSESETARLIQTTLTAYTAPIERAFSSDRGPTSETIRFDFASLMRADTGTRFAAYAQAQAKPDGSGWLTTDEIRALEGLNPLGTP